MNNTDRQKRFEPHLQADEKLLHINIRSSKTIFLWGICLLVAVLASVSASLGMSSVWNSKPFMGTINAMFLSWGISLALLMTLTLTIAIPILILGKSVNYCVTNQRIIILKNNNKLKKSVSIKNVHKIERKNANTLIASEKSKPTAMVTLYSPNNKVSLELEALLNDLIQKNNE